MLHLSWAIVKPLFIPPPCYLQCSVYVKASHLGNYVCGVFPWCILPQRGGRCWGAVKETLIAAGRSCSSVWSFSLGALCIVKTQRVPSERVEEGEREEREREREPISAVTFSNYLLIRAGEQGAASGLVTTSLPEKCLTLSAIYPKLLNSSMHCQASIHQ